MTGLDTFVLVGGRSSRLGRDKAFVEFGGVTLAARAARTIEAAFGDARVTFVAGGDSQFPNDAVAALGRPMIADLRPGFGAWSGLHAAVADARGEWALVLACDYPFVSAELLRHLVTCVTDDHDAVVPVQSDGRLQPLCAVYRAKPLVAEIEALMDSSGAMPPLVVFLDRKQTRRVEVDEYLTFGDPDRLFANINTPADLKLHEFNE